MAWLNFQSYSIWLNFGIFAVTAAGVWVAGARIARYADVLADRTGIGKAFMGLLLLAAATSSPEISTTLTAALSNSPLLAVNNLFGGITMQTAILAGVDLAIVRGALTVFTPRPVLLLEGVLLIVLLGLALAGFVVGEFFSLFGVGLWPIIFFGGYLLSVYLVHLYEGNERWQPREPETEEEKGEQEKEKQEERQNKESAEKVKRMQKNYSDWSVTRLILFFSGGTLVILAAGSILAQVGDVLASQTGLGANFVGVTLLAIATSLPELSTTISAAQLGSYSMAVSNIFGSNGFMVALLLVADLGYRQGSILDTVGSSAQFAAAMGIAVTGIFLAGMIERRDRTILRMGYDSAAVLAFYLGSLVVLYLLK